MSEYGTHLAIARARGGSGKPSDTARVEEAAVRAALAELPDPELPVVSIDDLGMIHRVEVAPDAIRVAILPTFVGCPALDVIRASIAERLGVFGRPVEVETSFEVPWTSDRISAAGRTALREVGIAPPAAPADVRCPWCDSSQVVMDSAFGPTQCRSLFYCRDCRQPFEALKSV
ncbi:MAG TPA: 1,2-phenylacetyl-CoA epoxidase subunit PaaD [Candidatus Limnocylindrales bacterium]